MDEKKVVSIRLNGKEKSYKECSKPANRKALFDDGHSSFSELAASRERDEENWIHYYRQKSEKQKQKNVIDFGAKQTEKRNLSLPFWDDGKRKKGPNMPPFGRKSKNTIRFSPNFFLNSLFFSALAAIIVGGSLGLLLLNIFTSEDPSSATNNQGEAVNDNLGDSLPVIEQEMNLTASIPHLEVFVIQEGAYSTMTKAEEAAASLINASLPAAIYHDSELSFLFMGASHNRESADSLASYFANQGKEVYVKTFAVNVEESKVSEEWADFLANGLTWMEEASILSAKGLSGEPSDTTSFLHAAEQWNQSLQIIKENPRFQDSLPLAEAWVAQALPIIQALENSPMTQGQAINIQQIVLDSLVTYEKIVLSLKTENN